MDRKYPNDSKENKILRIKIPIRFMFPEAIRYYKTGQYIKKSNSSIARKKISCERFYYWIVN